MPPPTPPPLRHTLAGRGSLLRRPPFAQLQHHPRLLTPILLPRRLFSTPTTDPTPPSTPPSTSFQKTLKAQRKERSTIKSNPGKATDGPILWDGIPGHPGAWEIVCGLEIHAQLNTPRKLFSDAKTSVNESPNTHVALFDAALPGSQPVSALGGRGCGGGRRKGLIGGRYSKRKPSSPRCARQWRSTARLCANRGSIGNITSTGTSRGGIRLRSFTVCDLLCYPPPSFLRHSPFTMNLALLPCGYGAAYRLYRVMGLR